MYVTLININACVSMYNSRPPTKETQQGLGGAVPSNGSQSKVCVRVRMCVCVYIYVYECVCLCSSVHFRICAVVQYPPTVVNIRCACMCVYVCVCMRACVCVCVFVCVCLFICVCVGWCKTLQRQSI